MEYDKAYVEKYRNKAITQVEDVRVGETYYSTYYDKITVLRLLTNRESYREMGFESAAPEPADGINWAEIRVHNWNHHSDTKGIVVSLRDNNVGGSYNPWLIFADRKTMEEYKKAASASLRLCYGNNAHVAQR